MPTVTLTCPACQFTKSVALSNIPDNIRRVTCPACQHRFAFAAAPATMAREPSPPEPRSSLLTGGGGDLRKPRNLLFASLFLLLFLALLGGRLYTSQRALNTPAPNFIAASEEGIATLWGKEVMVTDQAGKLLRRIALPDNLIPTQMIWSGNELWIADYRAKDILILGEKGQKRGQLAGPKISGHFKLVPDLARGRIFISTGHQMRLYDQQGTYLLAFGNEGREPGQLKFPNQFLLEPSGNLLIANTKSPAIDRYAPDGTFLARVVTPTGNTTYQYPTNVAVAADRIVTLEADSYLQDARIALYDSQGKYLGEHQAVPDFKLIGDIAVWGDRVIASDLANAKVYAFAIADLRFLGELSPDLTRLGNEFEATHLFWQKWADYSLWGMLALLVPIVFFYLKYRKEQAALPKGQKDGDPTAMETLDVNKMNRLEHIDLDALPPLEFLAVTTRPGIDLLAALLLGVPFIGVNWVLFAPPAWPQTRLLGLLFLGVAMQVAGVWLSLRTGWGCPVSRNKARKLLGKLLKNQGHEILAGVEQVGIGHCLDKSTLLLLLAPQHLFIADFNFLGQLNGVCRLPYTGIVVEDQKFLLPAFALSYGGKKRILSAADKTFMALLRATLEDYRLHPEKNDHILRRHAREVDRALRPMPSQAAPATLPAAAKPLNRKAALLSALLPGLGQFYKRHIFRGALFMIFFVPLAVIVAINLEPITAGTIDWAPQSVLGMGIVLSVGLVIFAVNIWDALRN
ncbi:MAG: hypothetical protein A2091_07145 [Desulfuromonadales bacterium GWD2_61_12]|nr:MAG: hypothetical protein A2091_07145 [Desulfuromonadales bacterium GWD2_61_12]HBT82107.1 hypothetical protein [Desulfuromonas sp.]